MPRNGSGIYGPPAGTAAVPNTTIESADYNAVLDDLAQALTDSINVDGTAPFQANQSVGNNKLVNLGPGSSATDSLNLGQAQSNVVAHATATGGSADAITAMFSPAFTAYAAKMRFRFTASAANTIASPTVNVDGLGAKTVKKLNGLALEPGDIAGSGHVCDCLYDGTDILLLNFAPMTASEANNFTARQTFTRPAIHPYSLLADAATIAWDMAATSSNIKIALSASRNLGMPTNLVAGQNGLIIIQQDGTGGWSLTPSAIFKQSGGQAVFDMDTAANSKTVYLYEVVLDHTGAQVILIKRLWSEGSSSIGYWKEYDAGTYTSNATRSITHNLGRMPSLVQCYLQPTTAEHGYVTTDYIDIMSVAETGDPGRKPAVIVSATTVKIRIVDNQGSIVKLNATSVVQILNLSTAPSIRVRVYE